MKKVTMKSVADDKGLIQCALCKTRRSWKCGGFTRHLKIRHAMSAEEYYVKHVIKTARPTCKCNCTQITTWHPHGGFYSDYVSGHNYRGHSKENDETVIQRTQKMIKNPNWKQSSFQSWSIEKRLIANKKSAVVRRHGHGFITGWYTSIKAGKCWYASSYELRRMKQLDNDSNVISWSRCCDTIDYSFDGKTRFYNPDFQIKCNTGEIRIEEIKGYIRDEIVKIKAIAAHKHYSSLNIDYRVLTLINDEFVEMKFL